MTKSKRGYSSKMSRKMVKRQQIRMKKWVITNSLRARVKIRVAMQRTRVRVRMMKQQLRLLTKLKKATLWAPV